MIWSENSNIRSWLPRLQAHRGYCVKGAVQNTLASIIESYKMGYEMAEFDVRLTADNIVILFHDDHLQNKIVSLTSYQELSSSIEITTFEELLNWFVKIENFKLNIEIKSRAIFNYRLEKKVTDLIKKYKAEERVLISSFNPLSLFKVRFFCSIVRRALLLTFEKERGNNAFVKSLILNFLCRPHMLNIRYTDYSKRFSNIAKKVPVVLWTVNNLEIYKKFKNEIHGIISDTIIPADMKEVNHAEIN